MANVNPFLIPYGYEVIPNVASMSQYTDIKKLDPNSPVLIGRKKAVTPTATSNLNLPMAGGIAQTTPSAIVQQATTPAPRATIANTPSARPANAGSPITLPVGSAIPSNATIQPTKKLATLYGPNGAKEVVEVGSSRASQLQSQGWGLTPGSYKPAVKPSAVVQTVAPKPANSTPFNIDTGRFEAPKPAYASNPFLGVTQPLPSQTINQLPINMKAPTATAQSTPAVVKPNPVYQQSGGDPFAAIKPIVQGVARSGASVALDVANALDKAKIAPYGQTSELAIDKTSPSWQQRLQETLFGKEPVKALSTRVAEAELKYPNVPKPLTLVGIAGLTALDFTPLGGEDDVVKALVKAKDVGAVSNILRKMKVPEDVIKQVASLFVETTNKVEIKAYVNELKQIAKEGRAGATAGEILSGKQLKILTDVKNKPADKLSKAIDNVVDSYRKEAGYTATTAGAGYRTFKIAGEDQKYWSLKNMKRDMGKAADAGRNLAKQELYANSPAFRAAMDQLEEVSMKESIKSEKMWSKLDLAQDAATKAVKPSEIVDEMVITTPKAVAKAKQVINTKMMNVSDDARELIENTARAVDKEIGFAASRPMKNKEILEAAVTQPILQKAMGPEATKKLAAATASLGQQLAAMSESGQVTAEFIEALKTWKDQGTAVARLLQARNIALNPEEKLLMPNIITRLLELGHSAEKVMKAAQGVNFNDVRQATAFYRKFVKPTLGEVVDEYRYINMLSSPNTHIVNAFSNIVQMSGLKPATTLVTGALDAVGSALTGRERQAYAAEVIPYVRGIINGARNAASDALKALQGKRLIGRPDVLTNVPTNVPGLKQLGIITRALEASDVFFQGLVRAGEKESLAYRYLKKGKLLTPEALGEIDRLASAEAQKYMFRQQLGKEGQGYVLDKIDNFTKKVVLPFRKSAITKWFVPFVTTPINILKQGIEYSPLGFTTMIKSTNKTEQLAKALIGSTVFAGAGALAMEGKLSWAAPTNAKERELFYASGRQPYSIKIGDNWYQYSRLGPLAYPLAMAAAVQWYAKENPKSIDEGWIKKTGQMIGAIGQFLTDQSYLQGITNLMDFAGGGAANFPAASKAIFADVTGQVIPLSSLQRWINNMLDNVYRQPPEGYTIESYMMNAMKSLPGASTLLPAYTKPGGEPSLKPSAILNAFSPAKVSPANQGYETKLQDYYGAKREEMRYKQTPEGQRLNQLNEEESANAQMRKDIARQIHERWKNLSKEEANQKYNQLKKTKPQLAETVKNAVEAERKAGFSQTEQVLSKLQVENGQRAKAIHEMAMKLETREERNAFIKDLREKKIVTDEVSKQLKALVKKETETKQ